MLLLLGTSYAFLLALQQIINKVTQVENINGSESNRQRWHVKQDQRNGTSSMNRDEIKHNSARPFLKASSRCAHSLNALFVRPRLAGDIIFGYKVTRNQLQNMLTFTLMSAIAAWPMALLQNGLNGLNDWQAPLATDDRGPCTGFNTLANHGYINRDGRNVTDEAIKDAFKNVFGMGDGITNLLMKQLKDLKRPDGNLDLNALRKHNAVEHDASLVHDDDALGPNWVVNQTLVEEMISYSADKQFMTPKDVGLFRKHRQQECKRTNSHYEFGPRQQVISFMQASTLINVLGRNDKVPVEYLRTFLGQERLPTGFVARSGKDLVSVTDSLAIAAQVKWHAGLFD